MATTAYFLNQYISTTLASVGGIDASQTTGIILGSVTNIDTTKPGIACLSYTNPLSTDDAEWITYTSIDAGTKELQGVTRGQEGYAAKAHSNGVTVAFPLSESHINNLNTALMIGASATNLTEGVLDEDDMASNSATKLPTQQSVKAMHDSGWTSITETLTYASATTITIAAGGASRYQKGDKLKLTQTTVKYFYIVGVADTLLTVTGGSDYTLANEAITSPQLSRIENPVGFPSIFNWTPTYTGFSANPTATHKFCIRGNICKVFVFVSGAGTSNANTFYLTAPTGVLRTTYAAGLGADNGSLLASPVRVAATAASEDFRIAKDFSGATWTTSGGKYAMFQIEYEIE